MIDATVVGSGPNGLAAAVTMARAGLEVVVLEQAESVGGGTRTMELTLPGFQHDACSAIHPAALASPFFEAFELTKRVPFIIPEVSYAHPLDEGRAAIAYRDVDRTAAGLGADGAAWKQLFEPLVAKLQGVMDFTGSQLLRMPQKPLAALLYALRVAEQGSPLWNARFRHDAARALFTGVAAHTIAGQPSLASAGAGLLLGTQAHAAGWGFPVSGSQAIADALAADLLAHGGRIERATKVVSARDLEPSRVTLLDTSVEFLAQFAGDRLSSKYLRALGRFHHGQGVAKLDFALSGPIPWSNPSVALAPTVHLGGTRSEIAQAENEVMKGRMPASPYVLLAQPSILDATRAPAGKQVLWAYTHVPRSSAVDPTAAVVAQIERFAPGFRDTILAGSTMTARDVEENNSNDVGGDILGGAVTLRQLVKRPVVSPHPWKTPVPGLYLCSASTPPGPAVHGMCGWYAARLALREAFGMSTPPLGL